ncbi:MAG: acyltransferase domain-containing protein [Planctomycetota bacterium]|nr:acyltransferase domain-containing protein [Planctomycetota bacterium]
MSISYHPSRVQAFETCAIRVDTPSVWLFPGLGSRFVGMGGDLIGSTPLANELIQQSSDWLNYDVEAVCLEGSGRKKVPPKIESQVLYVVNCIYAEVLKDNGYFPQMVCGHSLGSWAAAYAAEVYDFITGLELVTQVETILDNRAVESPEAMGVILGLPLLEVTDLLSRHTGASLANLNCPGQYVLAGDATAIEQSLEAAIAQGAYKTKRLESTRAFHTKRLGQIHDQIKELFVRRTLQDPACPFVSTFHGKPLTTKGAIEDYLLQFLYQPVYWEETITSLCLLRSVNQFLEVGPGTVLCDLMGYIDSSVAIQTASDFLYENA